MATQGGWGFIAAVIVARQDAATQNVVLVSKHTARIVHGLQGADAYHHLNVGVHGPADNLDTEVGREASHVPILGHGAVDHVARMRRVERVVAVWVGAVHAVARVAVDGAGLAQTER